MNAVFLLNGPICLWQERMLVFSISLSIYSEIPTSIWVIFGCPFNNYKINWLWYFLVLLSADVSKYEEYKKKEVNGCYQSNSRDQPDDEERDRHRSESKRDKYADNSRSDNKSSAHRREDDNRHRKDRRERSRTRSPERRREHSSSKHSSHKSGRRDDSDHTRSHRDRRDRSGSRSKYDDYKRSDSKRSESSHKDRRRDR